MTDADLMAELLGYFESREEAEHVVGCNLCSPFGEDGPFRCRQNPVAIQEDREADALHLARVLIWIFRGMPAPSASEQMMRDLGRELQKSVLAQVEQSSTLFDRMFAGGEEEPITFHLIKQDRPA